MDAIQNHSQNVINSLLLNASFIDNIGLMNGKMGISIFLFHLARKTQNQIYEDYAGELIDEIYEEIIAITSVNFENSLAGIGWGIEYLVQNKFIETDTDEILEEFDNRIFKELIYNTPKEIGLLNGLLGIGAYFLNRIKNQDSKDEKIPTLTNKQTLIHLIDELDRRVQDISEIIKEPEANTEILDLSNPEPKETFEPKPHFDITWNYPALLWFLAELYEKNIFNFKVEKIIQRLIEPLTDNTNLPKLQSNRILLTLALTKLQQTTNSVSPEIHERSKMNTAGRTNPESVANLGNEQQTTNDKQSSNPQTIVEQSSNLQTIIANLLAKITTNTLTTELSPNNVTIKHGTSGIAWMYRQLHYLIGRNHFKKEMEYWTKQTDKFGIINEILSGTDTEKSYGILEGLSGNLLITEIRK